MKTDALTPKQYLSDEGYGTGTNYTTGLVVELMKGYHAAQLEAGIKAKCKWQGSDYQQFPECLPFGEYVQIQAPCTYTYCPFCGKEIERETIIVNEP